MRTGCITLLLLFLSCLGYGKITLPGYFTDNMVLQQQTKVKIHGRSSDRGSIELRVSWDKKIYKGTIGENGEWEIELSTPKAGGPFHIVFSDASEECFLDNIMVGEVWFCSGQSNMEMPLAGWGKVLNYEQEIREADYPSIRLFQVKKETSVVPEEVLHSTTGKWQECSPASVSDFSSLGYFFARNLWNTLKVPVGIIDCTWGGTPIEGWSSYEAMKTIPVYAQKVEELQKLDSNEEMLRNKFEKDKSEWLRNLTVTDKGYNDGKYTWASCSYDDRSWSSMALPQNWEQTELSSFDGIAWFRKTIEIPQEWEGRRLTLRLGMIDDEDVTYFNGVEIARGAGYNSPRKYTVPAELVKAGKAVIAIKVLDYNGDGGICGKGDDFWISANEDGKTAPATENSKIVLANEWKYKIGISLKDFPVFPVYPLNNVQSPAAIYNAMVNPLISFPIKGILWYQGEANVGNADRYADMFQAMIQDWRSKWQNMEMPFYFVQLANYLERREIQPDSQWAALREAQSDALHLAHTGMVVNIDLGEANDIHPKNKQEVGRRLASLTLQNTYGQKVEGTSPVYKNYVVDGNSVRLSFEGVKKGFRAVDSLTGFTIAGTDHVFYKANAKIEGNEIVVWSDEVMYPVVVRYGWADNPDCNLYDMQSGLPISPFRTDHR